MTRVLQPVIGLAYMALVMPMADTELSPTIALIKEVGLPIAGVIILGYAYWKSSQTTNEQSRKDSAALAERLRAVEDARIADWKGVVEKNTEAMNRLADARPALQCPLKKQEGKG